MRKHSSRFSIVVLFLLALALTSIRTLAQESGILSGHVMDAATGEPLPGVNVLLKGTLSGASTDSKGNFTIRQAPVGTHVVVFSSVGYATVEVGDVAVRAGETRTLNAKLVPAAVSLGEISVYGVSLKRERITEAPAAVSVLDAKDIRMSAPHNQLPRVLESEPGVDIVQSGIQDFNINTRGFNSSLNRRLLVLMDGRDLAIAFLGAQEWNSLTSPLDDIARMELVRGPGSALYGPNAFNGVINISTPSSREVLGTKISVSSGELSLLRTDVRQAGLLSDEWSYRVNVGRSQSKTWSRSRTLADTNSNGEFEYPGLRPNRELRRLDDGTVLSTYGSGRLDYAFGNGSTGTLEGGLSQVQNEVFITGIGRVQVMKGNKPWGRLHYGSDNLNVNVWGQGRQSRDPQYSLASGAPLLESSSIYHAEAQYNFLTLEERVRVILGASHRYYSVDTDSTLMAEKHQDNTSGLMGQVEYSPISWVKFVGATRWDRSTLHSDQFSPKGAIVWIPAANHSIRATINKAFQVPNYSEFFLQANAGSADVPFFATPGNPRGTTPIYARGNRNLQVEKILGYELGYKGIWADNSLYLSIDAYYNQAKNFVTDLLQGVNPDYPFALPPGFPAGLADLARSNVPGLTTFNNQPAIVVSYTNAGKVDERGVEVGFNYYVTGEVHLDGNWTWYDFEVKEQQSGDVLLPNAPKHKFNLGVTYRGKSGIDFNITGRNVQPFRWAAGVFQGDINPYTLLNVSGGYQLNENFRVSATVSNALDHQVYQLFGGSLIGRQAIGTITATF